VPIPVSVSSTLAATCTVRGITAGTLRVSVLDVGQGDSILIQSPAGRTMLVDAGDTDAGSRVVADLKARGVTSLDAAVASHAHADHIGGYQAALSRFSVGTFYDSGYPSTSSIYENLLTTIDQKYIESEPRGESLSKPVPFLYPPDLRCQGSITPLRREGKRLVDRVGRLGAPALLCKDQRLVPERSRQTFDVPEFAADPFLFLVKRHGTIEVAAGFQDHRLVPE